MGTAEYMKQGSSLAQWPGGTGQTQEVGFSRDASHGKTVSTKQNTSKGKTSKEIVCVC